MAARHLLQAAQPGGPHVCGYKTFLVPDIYIGHLARLAGSDAEDAAFVAVRDVEAAPGCPECGWNDVHSPQCRHAGTAAPASRLASPPADEIWPTIEQVSGCIDYGSSQPIAVSPPETEPALEDGRLFDLLDEAATLIDDGRVAPSETMKCVYSEVIHEAIKRLRADHAPSHEEKKQTRSRKI